MNRVYLIFILNCEALISPAFLQSRTTLAHPGKAPAASHKSHCPPVLGCQHLKSLTIRRVKLGNFLPRCKEFLARKEKKMKLKEEVLNLTRLVCIKVIKRV